MPMLSSDTSSSLDLTPYILEDSLLCESITLSSLSSSTSSTPPIPAGCMVPLSTIVGHHDGPLMSRPASKATLTTPTPPRLRTMLREKLLVETWLTGLGSSCAGHTPWGDLDTSEATPWKSEGSLHTPDAFKNQLTLARRNRKKDPTPSISVTDTSQRTSNRNALVFEREIILDSGSNKSSRLSLQASVNMMDPGVAEMISELQHLNSFFKEEGTNVFSPATPQPPSLIVSNSHFSLPLSLESCGNLTPSAPLALAARRGKKMLPPLSFPQASDMDAYPSIPTAFLGSPSTYSPKFEFASRPNRRSMDLQQMVSSLRSQCAPIEPVEEDEWAFADGLLDSYNSRQFEAQFVKKPLLPDMINYAEESLSPKDADGNVCAPPSTPLPPCPESKPERAVRSILKSSKSVRFAFLPDERPASVASPPKLAPRRSLGSLSPPSKRSPLMRPRSYTVRPTTPTPLAPFRPPGPSPVRPSAQRRATTTAVPLSPVRPGDSTTSGSPRKAPVVGRHSLGRVFYGKENKDDGPPTLTRWTMNENALRRASVSGPAPQKSRMPVPLRNILTRFK
ncbi:hypothetical protein FB45DRAFT_925000 [Roridomyces roridus]|uniref:Uncharacterized protein n=1 Tax=Roridomyces roridus TaxID=1738132 RepID=A0AAD7BK55_9AGAR|nr:hypothetical protein FB45DRAFT_925000 [Roridomyces roridus]